MSSVTLSSNKIQNRNIPVPANPDPPGIIAVNTLMYRKVLLYLDCKKLWNIFEGSFVKSFCMKII